MIVSLQYLRGIAALMVVYHHLGYQIMKYGGAELPLYGAGAAGVDIFFVISGFIMWISTRSPSMTPALFVRRRIVRIVPLYWAVTLFLLALTFVVPQLASATTFQPWHAALSLAFIPTAHPHLTGEILPFCIPGWTLNYEMFFYAIFAVAMGVSRKSLFAVVLVALGTLAAAGMLLQPENTVAKFYTGAIVLEFAFGMALAVLYLRRVALAPYLAWLLAGGGLMAIILGGAAGYSYGPSGTDFWRVPVWGIPALAIVAGTLFLNDPARKCGSGPLWMIGESSYSLYLTHILALPAVILVWQWAGLGLTGAGAVGCVLTAFAAAISGGWLSYALFEKPAGAFLSTSRRALPATA